MQVKVTKQCRQAFRKLKAFLQSAPLLAHYDPKSPVQLAIHTLSFGLEAMLSHLSDVGEEKPITFAFSLFPRVNRSTQ